jgi:hypothetical protein
VSLPWRTPAALAFLLALTAGFYWQLTISRRYTWLENPDQALQVRPWLDYQAREWHAARVPLWAPYEWGGQSLIGQVQPGVANPLNWPLFALPLRSGHIPVETLHWYWVLIHWLAAAFLFWLCRDLGAGRAPSLAGGAIYALAGFVGHSDTPQFLMGAVWIPVTLLFLARVGRGERMLASASWGGAALAAAFLGGHHNIPIYTSLVLAGVWAWLLARHWPKRRMWIAAGLFGSVAALVAAVQILPAAEYGRQSLRWVGAPDALQWRDRVPYSIHQLYSLGLRAIPGLVLPGFAHHAEPFVGSAAVALALVALWYGWRRWEVRMLGAVALGGLLLAVGGDTPVERLAYLVIPMVEKARYPAFAIVICQAGVAALAALGLEMGRAAALARKPLRGPSLGMVGFAAAVGGYWLTQRWLGLPAYAQPLWPAMAAALGLALVWRWGRVAPLPVLALFLLEALAVPPPLQPRGGPGSYEQTIDSQSDIAGFLRRQPGWFRVALDEDAVPYNFGDWYGIEQFGGYTASMPVAVHAVVGHAEAPRLFGVEFVVARKPSNASQVVVFTSRSGLNVYRDPSARPPLWIERPKAETCAADQLRMAARTPLYTRIEAAAGCPGLLVVGDPWFTGWQAWVDGRRVRIEWYQGVIRAVRLPAGNHTVEFRYRPGSVWWGCGLSALGLLAALVVHVRAQ